MKSKIQAILRTLLPYLIFLSVLFYGIPLVSMLAGPTGGFVMLIAVLIGNPIASLFTYMICGIRHGFNWLAPLLCGLIFVPAVFIFLNSSGLIYPLAYITLAYIGMAIGYVMWRDRGNKPQGTAWG